MYLLSPTPSHCWKLVESVGLTYRTQENRTKVSMYGFGSQIPLG